MKIYSFLTEKYYNLILTTKFTIILGLPQTITLFAYLYNPKTIFYLPYRFDFSFAEIYLWKKGVLQGYPLSASLCELYL